MEWLLRTALDSVYKEEDKHKVLIFQPKALVENQKASVVPYFLISCRGMADMAENQAKA